MISKKQLTLVDQLQEIETDNNLQKTINNIKDIERNLLIKFEQSLLQPVPLDSEEYKNEVLNGLEHLSKTYLLNWINSHQKNNCCILLNYSSKFLDDWRIKTPKVLSNSNDLSLSKYLNCVLDSVWSKITDDKVFQLHKLAQLPIGGKVGRRRVPLFFVPGKNYSYKVENEFTQFCFPKFIGGKSFSEMLISFSNFINDLSQRGGGNKYSADQLVTYLSYLLLLLGLDLNSNYVEEIKKYLAKKGVDSKEIDRVVELRKSLGIKGIYFCTIAVSDELSNEALGTVMIFSKRRISAKLAWDLHELTFEYENALSKVDWSVTREFKGSNATLEIMSLLIDHEFYNLKSNVESILSLVEKDEMDIMEGIKRSKSYLKAASSIANAFRLGIENVEDSRKSLKVQEMLDKIKETWNFGGINLEIECSTTISQELLPRGYLLLGILQELVRNAWKWTPRSLKHSGSIPIKISVSPNNYGVKWSIMNRCESVEAKLNPNGKTLGSRIIFRSLNAVYRSFENLVAGPVYNEGWAIVTLLTPTKTEGK